MELLLSQGADVNIAGAVSDDKWRRKLIACDTLLLSEKVHTSSSS